MSANKIAVVGRIRSGKNTLADYLTAKYGHKQFQFGDGIKEVIMYYFPEAWIEGKPRNHYQVIGQSFRSLNPDIWVNKLAGQLDRYLLLGKGASVVIPDVRQANEIEYLKKNGFTIIKVESEKELRLERIQKAGDSFTDEQLEHETELATDTAYHDYLVDNNDSLDSLFIQVDFIIKELKGEEQRGYSRI